MISNKESGEIRCSAPSNIALVKYWGKYGDQLPSNPSISFTLNNCETFMNIKFFKEKNENFQHQFKFSGVEKPKFSKKITDYLKKREEELPFLKKYRLEIDSENTFPHSAGIASSASSMACLSYGLCSLEKFLNPQIKSDILRKSSQLARLGSGSACRSLYGGVVSWGLSPSIDSNLEFASTVKNLDNVFNDFCDSVLLVDSSEKSVSSRAGHALMNEHPFRLTRFENAKKNLEKIIFAMKSGDLKTFGEIVENEALELHGLMMNSTPSFILMKPNTLAIIDKIRKFRANTGAHAYFTLDAGPNIHLLYPKSELVFVQKFIKDELLCFTENKACINDSIGDGPRSKVL